MKHCPVFNAVIPGKKGVDHLFGIVFREKTQPAHIHAENRHSGIGHSLGSGKEGPVSPDAENGIGAGNNVVPGLYFVQRAPSLLQGLPH